LEKLFLNSPIIASTSDTNTKRETKENGNGLLFVQVFYFIYLYALVSSFVLYFIALMQKNQEADLRGPRRRKERNKEN